MNTNNLSSPIGEGQDPGLRDRREIEYQFSAKALARVERWLRRNHHRFGFELETMGRRELEDTYLDTEDWRIYRAGYKLRARRTGEQLEFTFKSLSSAAPCPVKDRREVTEVVAQPTLEASYPAKGLVADWLRSIAGGATPRRLFAVKTLRTTHVLKRGRRAIAEIALDESRISQTGTREPTTFRFVEVEGDAVVQEEVKRLIEPMMHECHLKPAQVSKFGAGLALNQLCPTTLPVFASIAISPTASLDELALHTLRQEFRELLLHEPGARLDEDPEELHQMRVACRRLRAGLRLFVADLPRGVTRCEATLRWLGGVLGEVRDLDVKADELRQWRDTAHARYRQEFELILGWVYRDRARARDRMLRALDSKRYARLQLRLQRSLAGTSAPRPGDRTPAVEALPALLRPLHKDLLKAGRRARAVPVPEHYHRLRIRCKRLRYALDFASVLGGKALKPYRKRLTRLQELLGCYNDTVVARAHLRVWLQESQGVVPVSTAFFLGRLEERLRSRGDTWLKRFPKEFRAFTRLRWRSVKAAFQNLS